MRPRGAGRGWVSAVKRQARYQRYYRRGSNASWQASKRQNDAVLMGFSKILGWLLLGLSALVVLVAGGVSGFHAVIMLVLTAPFWGLGLFLIAL